MLYNKTMPKEKKAIKELISDNSPKSYEILRQFYIDVIEGNIYDEKVTKEGDVVHIKPTIAVRVEAAAALQRMDIDKVQGNAKSKDTEDVQGADSDALNALMKLAEKRGKKI